MEEGGKKVTLYKTLNSLPGDLVGQRGVRVLVAKAPQLAAKPGFTKTFSFWHPVTMYGRERKNP